MREAQFIGAVRIAVNGSGEEVRRYLDEAGARGDGGGFDSPEDIIARWGQPEEAPDP